ncbi:TolB family protein [Maribacter sp. 2308TA10-17]|uniref:TolB family protein n=1 Tax=Maribacter sp. 2308TA10-17 TaxID=3386276 RepID=UPI0039BC3201
MKNSPTYKMVLTSIFFLVCLVITAQEPYENSFEPQKDSQYQKLKSLGYTEKEIYEDLGNANFLLEKYENAAFWYKKLSELQNGRTLSANYQKRYQFALEQTAHINTVASNDKGWLQQIKEDYQVKRAFDARQANQSVASNRREFDFNPSYRSQSLEYLVEYERNKAFIGVPHAKRSDMEETYESPIAVTSDGQTAYFSKAIYLKPVKGIFSKKELVHKIYRTDKINGQWKNVREMAVAPKHASAMHPAISEDGKRLFFASNMPGSFGKYDIYVADISFKGNAGKAKNLGTKVNTKKNDLYPRIMEDNTLVFASEGREGYGGLDLYMTQVGQNNVDYATNLGSPINSSKDEFSMYVMAERGIGYVLSNRGKNKDKIQEVAFSYENGKQSKADQRDSNLRAALNNKLQIDYTTSMFEDK